MAAGVTFASGANRTTSWTGVDEDNDAVVEASQFTRSCGSRVYASAQSGHTVTATPSGATSNETMVAIAWEP